MKREYAEMAVKDIVVKETMRTGTGDLSTLTASVKDVGLLHPLVVGRENVLICGYRRLEACKAAGLKTVPVIRTDVDPAGMEARDVQAGENLCREDIGFEDLERHIGAKKSLMRGDRGGRGLKGLFRSGSQG